MQTLVILLVALNSVSTSVCVWLIYRVLQGKGLPRLTFKPRFKPIPHKALFVPTRKVGIKGSNVEAGYFRLKDSPNADPVLVTHYLEQEEDVAGIIMERDSYSTDDGRIFAGEEFRARFVPAAVAQVVRVTKDGRQLAPARSTDRLIG